MICSLYLFVVTCVFQFPPSVRDVYEQSDWQISFRIFCCVICITEKERDVSKTKIPVCLQYSILNVDNICVLCREFPLKKEKYICTMNSYFGCNQIEPLQQKLGLWAVCDNLRFDEGVEGGIYSWLTVCWLANRHEYFECNDTIVRLHPRLYISVEKVSISQNSICCQWNKTFRFRQSKNVNELLIAN